MLRIHHVPATRGFRVIWLCEELEVPYEIVRVDFSRRYRASAEWRAMNPVGKVPVMTADDLTMFESGAMVQHVLDRHGRGRLEPARGTRDHALYLQWSWFSEATFTRPLGEIVNHRREFGDRAIGKVVEEMKARARLCLEALDRENAREGLPDRRFHGRGHHDGLRVAVLPASAAERVAACQCGRLLEPSCRARCVSGRNRRREPGAARADMIDHGRTRVSDAA